MMPYTVQKYLKKYNEDSIKAIDEKDDSKKLYHIKGSLNKINPNKIEKFFKLFKKLELSVEDIQKAEEFVFSWYEIPQSFIHDGAIEFSYHIKIKEDDYEFTHKGAASFYIDFDSTNYDDSSYVDFISFRNNWYSILNKTLKNTFPKIQQFYGYYIDCGIPRTFRDFLDNTTICISCQEQSALRDREEKDKAEEKSRIRKLKKLGVFEKPKNKIIDSKKKINFDINYEFNSPSELRPAIHKVYGGKCQYCDKPEPIPVEDTVVEHIITRSITIESVIEYLQNEGFSEDSITSFRKLLPPSHNSVLNLTLACPRHNKIKNNSIINPISMELLLKRSERKAAEVLRNHRSLGSSEGTTNGLDLT